MLPFFVNCYFTIRMSLMIKWVGFPLSKTYAKRLSILMKVKNSKRVYRLNIKWRRLVRFNGFGLYNADVLGNRNVGAKSCIFE